MQVLTAAEEQHVVRAICRITIGYGGNGGKCLRAFMVLEE